MHTRQASIRAFGRIGKTKAPCSFAKELEAVKSKVSSINGETTSSNMKVCLPIKRSFSDVADSEQPKWDTTTDKRRKALPSNDFKKISTSTPQKVEKYRNALPTPEATPTKSADKSGKLGLDSPIKHATSTLQQLATPPTTPSKTERYSRPIPALPVELQDLIRLHASFLKALSLHIAHNGPSSPIDIRILRPSIARIWRRRSVSTEDIRRCIGLLQHEELAPMTAAPRQEMQLYDYGAGRICIEFPQSLKTASGATRPLDEAAMDGEFADALAKRWSAATAGVADEDQDDGAEEQEEEATKASTIANFLAALPLAPIRPFRGDSSSASASTPHSSRSRSQHHLLDLKAAALAAQPRTTITNSNDPYMPEPHQPTQLRPPAPQTRSLDLLCRLRAKASLRASTADGASDSAATLHRRAALDRLLSLIHISEPTRPY